MTNPNRKRSDKEKGWSQDQEPEHKNREEMEREEQEKKRQEIENADSGTGNPVRISRGGVDFTPVDSYTGEPLPSEPAGDIPLDDLEVETFANTIDYSHLDEEKAMDFLLIDQDADQDPIMEQIDDFTDDQDILDDFAERQNLRNPNSDLHDKLVNHHSKGPQLSGGDIDAAWEDSDVSGEESVGGTSPTPDQDVVDELGEAVGISYDDDEELDTQEKLGERDRNRWELDPRSADEDQDDLEGRDSDERDYQRKLDDF